MVNNQHIERRYKMQSLSLVLLFADLLGLELLLLTLTVNLTVTLAPTLTLILSLIV